MRIRYKNYSVKVDGKSLKSINKAAEILGVSRQLLKYHVTKSEYNFNEVIRGKQVSIKEVKEN